MSSLDYLELCRLCLVKDRVSVPIFEGEGDVRQIFLKIAACLPVKVAREDKLPKKICDDCVYKVELFYQFWNTTANAEKQLVQWLGESGMKGEGCVENRLDRNVMQVGEHQNNMGMGMMDNMSLGIPMIISNTNQQQITSVPMDTSTDSVQTIQAVPGPSSQTTHNQISRNQTSSGQQEDEEEDSEEEENTDDECDGEDGLPVKEESEEDPSNRTIEPTTFVNVSLACDEAGPSGLQQQKISDIPEMPIPQPADNDPKSGISDPLGGEFKPFEYSKELPSSLNKGPPKKPYLECDHCKDFFHEKKKLIQHMKTHDYKCSVCSKTFKIRKYLSTHVSRMHQPPVVFDCSVCDYKTDNKGTLKNHYIRLHTSNYNFICNVCGKQFKIKKALNHHVKQAHSDSTPIVCDVCGHFSKNLHALKAHMKYRHYKPEFVCRICKRGMTTQENLDQHLTWHETREKVLCPTCGKKFRSRDLDSHMRVHTGVKPFPCPVCGKTFRRQTTQEQHLLIHTGKKPYICDICGHAFAQKPGLICHRKRHPGPLPPLPAVSVKNIVTEFTKDYMTKNMAIKVE